MYLVHSIRAFFQRDDIAQSLTALGECVGGLSRIVVVGGALRELVFAELCSTSPEIPDIDVAILGDIDPHRVIRRLGPESCALNSFGGIKWQVNGSLPLDIWTVRAWAQRIGKVSRSRYRPKEVRGFLDFNVNAGLYAPHHGEVDVDVITNAVKNRKLELHNSLVPPDSVQIARIIKLESRVRDLGFELGPELRRYAVRVIDSLDPAGLMEAKAYFERKDGRHPGDAGAYFEAWISRLYSGKAPTDWHSRVGS